LLTLALVVQIVVLFGTPLLVGLWLNRRWAVSWMPFLGGALAFVASWVVVSLLPTGSALNLVLMSITQMAALYVIYRFQLKTVRTEREAVMVGVGQAGIELMLLGVIAIFTLLQLLPLRNATDDTLIDLTARIEGISAEEVQPSQLDELRDRIDSYWDRPWYSPAVQLIQPLAFLPILASLAVIVLWAVTQNNLRPLLGAMALYYLSRALPAYAAAAAGPLPWIVLSLLFGGIAIWFLKRLHPVVQRQNELALSDRRSARKSGDQTR
jgi:uncharacterized membrane protein YhfC